MSNYVNTNTTVITQGITGKTGQFHTEKCQEYAHATGSSFVDAASWRRLRLWQQYCGDQGR